MIAMGLNWREDNNGSGNGLVPSGNKPLPMPTLALFCHYMVSLGLNDLRTMM